VSAAHRVRRIIKKVLGMPADGLFYRLIARNVGMSKNTVMDIVRRSVHRSVLKVEARSRPVGG
jgi:AraC-like DNA-binding protein